MDNAMTKRFLGYRRTCTDNQGAIGTSLSRQKEELAGFAARIEAPIVLDFIEIESGSAKAEARRFELARLIESVRPGDVVAVSSLSRISRDLGLAIRKVQEILNKGARFISVAEGELGRLPGGEFALLAWSSLAQRDHAEKAGIEVDAGESAEPHTT